MVEKTCHLRLKMMCMSNTVKYGIWNFKTKIKTFSSVINTFFTEYEIPKERVEYVCVACISVNSVFRVDKKNYMLVY